MASVSKLVFLRLDGDFAEHGFRVSLEIGTEQARPEIEILGNLPPNPTLVTVLHNWQQAYLRLGLCNRLEGKGVSYGDLFNRRQECQRWAEELRDRLNAWLEVKSFQPVDRRLREALHQAEPIRVLIRTNNPELRRLPWHLWDFIERYPQAEIALSAPSFERVQVTQNPAAAGQVRILAILGNSAGIDIEQDRLVLEQLPNAQVTFLVEPQRQDVNDQLWDQPWDILFFAGHSQTEGNRGLIHINPQESLTISELQYGLKQAIAQGLQLAIFNSCDGLGLASDLEQLHLPQLIVMRQPVPDPVAQQFAKYLLTAFANGESLYLAARKARQRLHGLESTFPCASWLPVICQNAAAIPPTWQALIGAVNSLPAIATAPTGPPTPRLGQLSRILAMSLVVGGLMVGVRSLGWLQAAELWAYDQFTKQQVRTTPDPRLLVVGVNDADMRIYGETLSDRTVYQLLTKLEKYQPKVVGLDILRDQPQGEGWQDLTRLLQTSDRVVAICQDASDRQLPIAPPPKMPAERVGYVDTLIYDADDVIRRYVIAQAVTGASSCSTPYSLTFQIMRRFLPANTSYQLQPGVGISINNQTLGSVQPNLGGYQLTHQDTLGYQLLVDYRAKHIAQVASLTDILNATDLDLQNWIRDRIVLIGYMGNNSGDDHLTPLGNQAGVIIHAYVLSQVLNAVTTQKPLLSSWAEPLEAFWILGWSAIAGVIIWKFQTHNHRFILPGVVLIVLCGSSLLLFQQSIWVPVIPAALVVLITSYAVMYFTTYFPPDFSIAGRNPG